MDNNCVKYHPHLRDPWKVMVWNKKKLWLYLRHMSLSQGHDTIARYIIKIPVITYGPDTVLVCVHSDHYLGDMTLGQGHDTPFGNGKQLSEILSRSNLTVRSYGPDTDFRYMCTVTLTSEIWPWVKVMTQPWVIDNNCVKYYPDPTWQWGVMARTRISSICAPWPWPWRYDLGSRSWHTLATWISIVLNIIQIQLGSEELWPGHGFPECVHCDLDLGDMTLGQVHDTPLGHGQQLCEIISRSVKGVRSYGQDTMWTDGPTDRQQWCRNSSDLSDNRTFLMNVRQKMLECRTKCPTEIIKRYPFDGWKEAEYKWLYMTTIRFYVISLFCRHK